MGTVWAWKQTVLVVVGFGGERFGTCKQTAHVGMVMVLLLLLRHGEWLVLVLANDLFALVTSLEFLES